MVKTTGVIAPVAAGWAAGVTQLSIEIEPASDGETSADRDALRSTAMIAG